MRHQITPWLAVLTLAVLVTASCNKGDRVAPEGSTIDLAATPSTVLMSESVIVGGEPLSCTALANVAKCGISEVVATVSSAVGVPLPDQDVRFTNTAGKLYATDLFVDDAANIPIRTDSFGNAHVWLLTNATTTVNARSGKATGSLTLQTTLANISSIRVEQDETGQSCVGGKASTPGEILSCNDEICLVATVLDDTGAGVPNIQLSFKLVAATGTNSFEGSFTPSQPSTSDPDGTATTILKPSSTCTDKCTNFQCDGIQVVATTIGGVVSPGLPFTIAIPQ